MNSVQFFEQDSVGYSRRNLKPKEEAVNKFIKYPEFISALIQSRKINCKDAAVYSKLISYAHTETGECFPSQSRLAYDIGISLRSTARAISRLKRAGLISSFKKKDKNTCNYIFLDHNNAVKHSRCVPSVEGMPICHNPNANLSYPICQSDIQYRFNVSRLNDTTTSTAGIAQGDFNEIKGLIKRMEERLTSFKGGFAPLNPPAKEEILQIIKLNMSLISILTEEPAILTPPTPSEVSTLSGDSALNAPYKTVSEGKAIEQLVLRGEVKMASDVSDGKEDACLRGAIDFKDGSDREVEMFTKEMQMRGLKKKEKKDPKVQQKLGLSGKRSDQVMFVFNSFVNACKQNGFDALTEPSRNQATKISNLIKTLPDIHLIGRVVEFAVANWKEMSETALPADMHKRCGSQPILEVLFTPTLFENWMRIEKDPSIADKPKRKAKNAGVPDNRVKGGVKGFDWNQPKGYDPRFNKFYDPNLSKGFDPKHGVGFQRQHANWVPKIEEDDEE